MKNPLSAEEKQNVKDCLELCREGKAFAERLARAKIPFPEKLQEILESEEILKGIDQQFVRNL